MSQWREAVLLAGKCKWCRAKDPELEADHIVPLSVLVKRFDLESLATALACDPLWYVANGQALCHSCHVEKTYQDADKYGWDKRWVKKVMGPRLKPPSKPRPKKRNLKGLTKNQARRAKAMAVFDARLAAHARKVNAGPKFPPAHYVKRGRDW